MLFDKCSIDLYIVLFKFSFVELFERYKNLKKFCYYWKLRIRYYMKN